MNAKSFLDYLDELERLAEIGVAVEFALKERFIIIIPNDNDKVSTTIYKVKDLLEWCKKEVSHD